MKVLLLGASGLLGHNVLKLLLDEHHDVVVLVRRCNAIALQHSQPYTTLIGSLLDYTTLLNAAQHCDAIINCAGTTDMSLRHLDDYLPVNQHLCTLLIQLVDETHINTLVHVSTANTIGYGTPEQPANETAPFAPPFSQSFYAQSKQAGENILLNYATQHHNKHIIVLNPGFMVGAYDVKPSSGKLLTTGFRRPLMMVPRGGKSFIHVADAATATVHALTLGSNGKRYLLTGCNLSLKEFYALQAKTLHYRQLIVTLPNGMVRAAGKLGDLLRFCGIKTQLSSRNVNQLLICEYYTARKAIDELQMPQTPIAQAISDFWNYQK